MIVADVDIVTGWNEYGGAGLLNGLCVAGYGVVVGCLVGAVEALL